MTWGGTSAPEGCDTGAVGVAEKDEEFASPACSAHEMDPGYMWARQRPRAGWMNALRRLLGRQP